MSRISILSAVGLMVGLLTAAGQGPATSAPARPPAPSEEESSAEKLVRQNCSVCHSFRLVESQRLNRANWEWVMDDMVNKYGALWISKDDQARIIDYLVEHYGPEKK
jgi:cytochrome c-type biogenesis protein CcmH/NrfF